MVFLSTPKIQKRKTPKPIIILYFNSLNFNTWQKVQEKFIINEMAMFIRRERKFLIYNTEMSIYVNISTFRCVKVMYTVSVDLKSRDKRMIKMDLLDKLEARSIYILREAYSEFKDLCMLWSIGKDSTVMLWLARKAFFGHVPFSLVHIDTHYKIPEMIEYRDKLALQYHLDMVVGQNIEALEKKETFPHGNVSRIQCCQALKSEALKKTINGQWKRWRLNHDFGKYELDKNHTPYTGVIVGARADEEGSRSKERYFSPRNRNSDWNIGEQPPEFWNQYNTSFPIGTHLRIHPLLDWTELNIWQYIKRENIPMVSLYFNQGEGTRYRSLGCYPCTSPIESDAKNVDEIIEELESGKLSNIAERSGREQDKEGDGTLEELRKQGYM
jgi:sulfate adenylyltransferase subunit 2